MFEPVTAAQAFAAMVRPHLLFVDAVAQRQRILQACLHAWNMGSLGTAAERAAAIEASGQQGDPGGAGPPAFTSSEVDMLRALVEQRCQTFPFLRVTIRQACLQAGPTQDQITIDSAAGPAVFRVNWQPTARDLRLPNTAIEELSALLPNLSQGMGEWLRSSTNTPDVWATRACNRCRLILLELSTYRSTLIRLEASVTDAEERHWLVDRRLQIDRMEQWTLVFVDALGRLS